MSSSHFVQGSTLNEIIYDLRKAWNGSILFAASPAEGEGEEKDPTTEGGNDEGEGSGASGSDANSQEGSAEPDIKDPEKKRLHEEAAANRTRAKAAETERDAFAKKLREYEDKDKSELQKVTRDRDEALTRAEKAEEALAEFAVKLAFFESGMAAQFHNPSRALQMLRDDLKGIKPDEDGVVDVKAVKAAAENLLKTDSYLAKGNDSSSDEDGSGTKASGQPNNGTKKTTREADREALMKKFPALRR